MNTHEPASTPATLTAQELRDMLRITERTLERWRINGTGPAFVKVGRSFRYPVDSFVEWLASNTTLTEEVQS